MTADHPGFADATWSKSSFSDDSSANCVEVAFVPGWVGIRDSKQYDRSPVIAVTATAWSAFLAGVRTGEFTDR